MVIDFHTHLFPDRVRGEREEFCDDAGFRALYADRRSRMASPEELLASMKECGVDVSVAMAFPWCGVERCLAHNRYLAGVSAASGGRIVAFGAVPACDPGAIDEAAAEMRQMGLRGIGEIALYARSSGNHNLYLETLFDRAEKYNLALCLHVNEPVGHDYPGKCAQDFTALYRMLEGWGGPPVVLSHWGGGMLFYELMPEVSQALAGVYYDTAASPFLYRNDVYRVAMDILGPDKVLFGSDFPLLSPSRYFTGVDSIADPEARSKVMGLNAARILGKG